MQNLLISPHVLEKIQDKHGLTRKDVEECFVNREGPPLIDSREEHKTDPVTQWFISENYYGKLIKIVFVQLEDGRISLKSAYQPSEAVINLYRKKTQT